MTSQSAQLLVDLRPVALRRQSARAETAGDGASAIRGASDTPQVAPALVCMAAGSVDCCGGSQPSTNESSVAGRVYRAGSGRLVCEWARAALGWMAGSLHSHPRQREPVDGASDAKGAQGHHTGRDHGGLHIAENSGDVMDELVPLDSRARGALARDHHLQRHWISGAVSGGGGGS